MINYKFYGKKFFGVNYMIIYLWTPFEPGWFIVRTSFMFMNHTSWFIVKTSFMFMNHTSWFEKR